MPRPTVQLEHLTCRVEPQGAERVRLGEDTSITERFKAVFEEKVDADTEPTRPRITLEVRVENSRARCFGVTIEPTGRHIKPEDMRPPLEAMLRMAVAKAPQSTGRYGDDVNQTDLIEEHYRRLEGITGRQRRNALDDKRLEEVTRVYREAQRAGDKSPTRAVARELCNNVQSTAGRQVSAARKRGAEARDRAELNADRFLGPTVSGKKGELQ